MNLMTQASLSLPGWRFDGAVAPSGYRWWYIDAFSPDGRCGMTLIAFVGSVFSPYYFRARTNAPADPENYCSINAIFYGPDRKRWAMTERGRGALERSAQRFRVGPSALEMQGSTLTVNLDERCVPFPSRLRGRVEVTMPSLTEQCFILDAKGQHRWWPAAPTATVSVSLQQPALSWQGDGYVDCNAGVVPLEESFRGWHWTRTSPERGRSAIFYQREMVGGERRSLMLINDDNGLREHPAGSSEAILPATTVWRCPRPAPDASPKVLKTYEDTPFYARSKIHLEGYGHAMHESLDLTRFKQPWVQMLLPFRMPRRAG